MLMNDNDVIERLTSVDNLINRMRLSPFDSASGMKQVESHQASPLAATSTKAEYIPSVQDIEELNSAAIANPLMPPSVDELMGDFQSKVKLGLAADGALDVLIDAVNKLKPALIDVETPKELSKIAGEMSKIVTGIRNSDHKKQDENLGRSQVIIWKPIVMNESHYESIHVNE